ncbi:MAG: InlB B-repeat-containing protein, partial [bacterium]
ATFAIQTYTLTATAGENGTITPAGEIIVEHGSSQTFTIAPENGYFIEDVWVDGESTGPVESYTFDNITAEHSIHATFAIHTYTLTATAGENGTITPSGEISVEHGASQTFTLSPDEGYFIEDVMVDGESVGPAETYTFEDITRDHAIVVVFALSAYRVVFEVEDEESNPIEDASVTFDGQDYEAGNYVFEGIVPGLYLYTVAREGYFPESGEVQVENQDITQSIILQWDDNSVPPMANESITIHPNPARTFISIHSSHTVYQVQIFTIGGLQVMTREIFSQNSNINIRHLDTGTYIVTIRDAAGLSSHKIQIIR